MIRTGIRRLRSTHTEATRQRLWNVTTESPRRIALMVHVQRSFASFEIPPTDAASRLSTARVCATHEIDPHTTSSPFQPGPPLELGWATLGLHTHSSVVATCGSTVVLVTVARQVHDTMEPVSTRPPTSFLTVEHRQRVAAVGQIPTNRRRSDSGPMTREEILASRCIDRALRPLLRTDDAAAAHYHIHSSVQCYHVHATEVPKNDSLVPSGNAVATALNAAAAALRPQLTQAVAATVLAVYQDAVVQDGTDRNHCIGHLLYAGTKTHAVMMEWTSQTASLPEAQWTDLLALASRAIQPILHAMDTLQTTTLGQPNTTSNDTQDTTELRHSLGLTPLPPKDNAHGHEEQPRDEEHKEQTRLQRNLLDDAIRYCREQLGNTPALRLFGVHDETTTREMRLQPVFVHQDANELLSKSYRGRRETILTDEIARLVDQFVQLEHDSEHDTINVARLPVSLPPDRAWLREKVTYALLSRALFDTSYRYGTRADGRRGDSTTTTGWKTVRPVRLVVPALPDAVHGSALFARGDTQVLCTVTLGAPRDGQPWSDPYQPLAMTRTTEAESSDESLDKLPVGSLRFLRTQEALEADLNSRKSKADKERTGESGSLAEVKRAFLQYDFPAYSTGEVPTKGGIDRRSVGHGALAERAILPALPDQDDFPYAIRITSEVTDSNGSSSMASVCGATLALLDAGVPMKEAVAGVSVGLAVCHDESDAESSQYSLLLDITGTEDHYGAMDFKIAGTRQGVTAVQLDVKEPVPNEILIQALNLAKSGRIAILDVMQQQSIQSFGGNFCRPEPKKSAPRVEVVRFDPQRKRDLVGPGGAVLRQLEDRYGVSLDLTQEGQCLLFGTNREMVDKAKWTVMDLVADVVQGEVYTGTVIEIKDFGAIIELLRNKEGLLHVSELSTEDDDARHHPEGNAGFVNQHLRIGQKIEVMCIGVDPIQGSVKLSRKALLERKKKVYSGGINGKG